MKFKNQPLDVVFFVSKSSFWACMSLHMWRAQKSNYSLIYIYICICKSFVKRKATSIVNQILGEANPSLDHELIPTTHNRRRSIRISHVKKVRKSQKDTRLFNFQDEKLLSLFPLLWQMLLTMSSVVYRIVHYGEDKCELWS